MAVPVAVIRRNHIIRCLKASGAFSEESALTLADAGVINPYGFALITQRLVYMGLINETEDGRYYIDEGCEEAMTQQNRRGLVVVLAMLVFMTVLVVTFSVTDTFIPESTQSGSEIVMDDTGYSMTFTDATFSETRTMALKTGDSLAVSFGIRSGRADLTINGADGETIYRGNDLDSAAFELPISQSGDLTISLSLKNASGAVDFAIK